MKQSTFPDRKISDHQLSGATVPEGGESVMMCSSGHCVTIVDDDPGICDLMERLLADWKFIPSVLPEPYSLSDLLKIGASTDVFLLDVRLPSGTTLNWIPAIMDTFPEAKVIVMTGYTDTDTVIQAIRNGAFDFLQKPIAPELMKNSILRALQLQEKDRNIKTVMSDLQHSHTLLLDQKQKLEFLNERLMETNRAFSTLAQNLDFERAEILSRITRNIESGVIPALSKIRSDAHLARYSIEIDMIIHMLHDITFGASPIDPLSTSLTTAEARVASLIKKGLTTDKIAEQLFISTDTVKTHRKNIRKKLNITNSQSGLKEYLLNRPANARA
ncbi:MAG: response regulator [Desulfatirhabdiaceae bacterium]|nr:response regulator [Desulfatirhabdiaceae bacterium]